MKNKILELLIVTSFMFFIGLCLSSCAKNDLIKSEQPESMVDDADRSDESDLFRLRQSWNPWTQSYNYFCMIPPVNCFSEVIIKPGDPTKSSATKSVEDVYVDFKTSIVKSTTRDFFNGSEYAILFPALDGKNMEGYLSTLQSKTIRIIEHYNPEKDNFVYLVVNKDYIGDVPEVSDVLMTLRVKIKE